MQLRHKLRGLIRSIEDTIEHLDSVLSERIVTVNGQQKEMLIECGSKIHDAKNYLTIVVTNLDLIAEQTKQTQRDIEEAMVATRSAVAKLLEAMQELSDKYKAITEELGIVDK